MRRLSLQRIARSIPGILVGTILASSSLLACTRTTPSDTAHEPGGNAPSTPGRPEIQPSASVLRPSGDTLDPLSTTTKAAPPTSSTRERPRSPSIVDGPHQLLLAPERPIYFAFPNAAGAEAGASGHLRLIGHLHGMCGAPSYACGKWVGAAVESGFLICPTGNGRCGDSPVGPPSWEAPSWSELVALMDADLEASIAKVAAKYPSGFRRDGAVLTGYSRGAFAAPVIARRHPGRWPYLVLIEANAPLKVAELCKSGVLAVSLVAGEWGTEIEGERKTETELVAAGFPARLFVMPKTGHLYSDDMERVMHDALAFVLANTKTPPPCERP
ncbi:hypothetical protein [Labilithrix luteola]|nr:hypothetical protein [Labilithrix luteola]